MTEKSAPVLFTLGHSRHAAERFVDLLAGQSIQRIVDVRGQPYSRFNPQFNRERLARTLEAAGVDYDWQGEYLSGRPRDPAFRGPDGAVLWDRLRLWPELHRAVDLVAERSRDRVSCLICAEEDPLRCHRRFLLAPLFRDRGFSVRHIRRDGQIQREEDLPEPVSQGQLDLFS